MSPTPPKIAVVGSLHYDIMLRTPHLPRLGETLMGSDWWWKPGGKGGNQAIAAARHGGAVYMIGALGADDFGAKLRMSLASAGVDHQHVLSVGSGSGISVALVEAGGDYSAVVVSGANLTIDAAQVAKAGGLLRQTSVLILQNEVGDAANIAAARSVKAAGGTVVYNAAPARKPSPEAMALVDILVVNAIEADMFGAGRVDDLASALTAARQLRVFAPAVVVTAGKHGLALSDDGRNATLPAYRVANAQTHGAGDAFIGALAARLAEGAALKDALSYANAAAALHVGANDAGQALVSEPGVRALQQQQTVSWSGAA